ncbi:NAD(P)-binding protein [Microstroma glucosiphilum]|uniref:NAD(P)-binding protein n=1 Tax=Pseudomicrostroma glucosiphilum TaxID=1684307 RepID=A0A316UCD4_9BASI|nr:NAD(P)-binding protein [Pseudomicrostroma glucosiphilum]PWN22897.1 NAD(P)-binding protein [Pseudomicrostroma glucosiphilum]
MVKTFFITGTTTGFGAEMAKAALADGHNVVATARNSKGLTFEGATEKNFLPVDLDVTKKEQIDAAFDAAIKKFGRLDVVTNNAGFGLAGPFETLDEDQIRFQMEVNFFGLIACTRKALEIMRTQSPSGGLIQQVTSIGGQRGVPMFSVYCASKWAVEGFTEALSHELKPEWNIKLTNIEPGGFRTEWAGKNMTYGEKNLDVYSHLNAKKSMGERHGKQAGDPVKAGKEMYKLAIHPEPPLRIVLGSDAHGAMEQKLKTYKENIDKWASVSTSTDVDEGK